MEQQLSEYMMRFSKFEFLLMRMDPAFVQTNAGQRVVGVQWEAVANKVEAAFPWATFDFASSGFEIFRDEPPQYLTLSSDDTLVWDSDMELIGSWSRLLTRSFAQLRNNIAHGSKGNPPRPFTHGRTPVFLSAGHALMTFLADRLFPGQYWDEPLYYA